MSKALQTRLDVARLHLMKATAEMASAAAVLDDASLGERGDRQNRLALMAEVVNTQKDLAAGLAVLVKNAPGETFDLLLATLAFGRAETCGPH